VSNEEVARIDSIVLVVSLVLIAWGLLVICFAHTIHTHGPFRNASKGQWASSSRSMVVRRVFGGFWVVVGLVLLWFWSL